MKKQRGLRILAAVVLILALFTACTSKAAKAVEKVELGQKYLTELNYTEAVASFTEAIGLDPENIPAYMGRAEAYVGLKQYDDAKVEEMVKMGMFPTKDFAYRVLYGEPLDEEAEEGILRKLRRDIAGRG